MVGNRISMAKMIIYGLIVLAAVVAGIYLYYYNRWQYLWALEEEREPYAITRHADDTLRIAMIGDSWVGMRKDVYNESLGRHLSQQTGRPVVVATKGKGGEKSRGIYRLMFEDGVHGTHSLIADGPDFCVVFAGINDCQANLGTNQFRHHFRMILQFLLQNGIRPVVVEIPDVDIWTVKKDKPWKDLMSDFVKSTMGGGRLYQFADYREALNEMLTAENLLHDVVFVPMNEWSETPGLFLDDRVHLNDTGYSRMDSCIAKHIADYLTQNPQ